jgi:hypothetical protein
VPFNTNAGLLFYNKAKVHTPPTTWQQTYHMAKQDGGLGYQGAQYEGLTVNFLELLYAAGQRALIEGGAAARGPRPCDGGVALLHFRVERVPAVDHAHEHRGAPASVGRDRVLHR